MLKITEIYTSVVWETNSLKKDRKFWNNMPLITQKVFNLNFVQR